MFHVNYTVDHSWLKLEWQDAEKPESVVKVTEKEVYTVINDAGSEACAKHLDNSVTHQEFQVFEKCFRTEALGWMMNGVLEVKLGIVFENSGNKL